jgi:hypothetical protein
MPLLLLLLLRDFHLGYTAVGVPYCSNNCGSDVSIYSSLLAI